MDEWLPLVAYGLNRISLETNARCGRCNKEAKRKSFLKGDIGYTNANPDLRHVTAPPEPQTVQTVDLAALIEQLQQNPELANTLAALIAGSKNSN